MTTVTGRTRDGRPVTYVVRGGRFGPSYHAYIRDLLARFNRDQELRRRLENTNLLESGATVGKMPTQQSSEKLSQLVQLCLKCCDCDTGDQTGFGGPLPEVDTIEFYPEDNARRHHTSDYDLVREKPRGTPVLRRGENFYVAIRTKSGKKFNPKEHVLRLILNFGANPSVPKGTKAVLSVTQGKDFQPSKEKEWDVRIHQLEGSILTLQVQIPPSAPVGVWKCGVETGIIDNSTVTYKEFKAEDDIYILFNPWSPDDGVYMENERDRKEYVLNETGKIFVGSHKQSKGRRWAYAQFDDDVLPACVFALELARLPAADRASPVKVVRAISAIVNHNNENGVVQGRWDGSYEDGTAPYDWTGSASILEKYLASGGQPVKYGQCWVFAGVTTTVCRALGIPCRPISNFVSAHDTDATLTVDKYFDVHGEEIKGGPTGESFDSIWNFHVWNETWMTRPDLPPGYGGWQVIDSTPQEESDSRYQLGPTSVVAVKRGEVGLLYDTPFVFSEVNADVMHWMQDTKSDWGFSLHRQSTDHVGKLMLTKSPYRDDDYGDSDAVDITDDYKNLEGSTEERMAVMNAVRGVDKARRFFDYRGPTVEDVSFELADIDKIGIGQPFRITINVINKSNEARTIKTSISAASVYYTGIKAKLIKKTGGKFVLRPRYRETLSVDITSTDYLERLVDYGNIKIYALATVEETRQTWSGEDDFIIEKPVLNILVREAQQEVGKQLSVTFSFKNPLQTTLTDCRFSFEGPGLQRAKMVSYKDVGPRESVSHTERFVPKKEGPRKIIATFSSKQLIDITGATTVNVRPKSRN